MYVLFSSCYSLSQPGIDTSVTLSESNPPEVALVQSATSGVVQSTVSIASATIRITNALDGVSEALTATPPVPITVQH